MIHGNKRDKHFVSASNAWKVEGYARVFCSLRANLSAKVEQIFFVISLIFDEIFRSVKFCFRLICLDIKSDHFYKNLKSP